MNTLQSTPTACCAFVAALGERRAGFAWGIGQRDWPGSSPTCWRGAVGRLRSSAMRAEIVRLVFPVFTAGLQRRQELLSGVPLELDTVQKELVGLVQATTQTAAWVQPGRLGQGFLGIPYALACWLDELFIQNDSPWMKEWSERKIETELFETTDRS